MESVIERIILDGLRKEGYSNPKEELSRRRSEQFRRDELLEVLDAQWNNLPERVHANVRRNNLIDELTKVRSEIPLPATMLSISASALAHVLPWTSSKYNEWTKRRFINEILECVRKPQDDELVHFDVVAGVYSEASTGGGKNAGRYGLSQSGGHYHFIMLDGAPYLFDERSAAYCFAGCVYPEKHIPDTFAAQIHERYIELREAVSNGSILEITKDSLLVPSECSNNKFHRMCGGFRHE